MPLADFISEVIEVLGTDSNELVVERAKDMRENPGVQEYAFVDQFNDIFVSGGSA